MSKKVEVSYVQEIDEKGLRRIAEILSDGIYTYLRKSGLLRENPERTEVMKVLLERAKVAGSTTEDDSDYSDD